MQGYGLTELICAAGSVLTVEAPPYAGKRMFALSLAAELARKCRVGFFTASLTPVGAAKGLAAAGMAADAELELVFAAGMTAEQIVQEAAQRGYQILFVDDLQLLCGTEPEKDRKRLAADAADRFRAFASEAGVSVVLLLQASRPAGRLPRAREVA